MPITPFTATPDESMSQEDFDVAASIMVSEFAGFITELNALAVSLGFSSTAYLGPKSSDPTVDNLGNALTNGTLYFNTAVPELRVYNGSTWTSLPSGNYAAIANNLSDLADAATARGNLGAAESGANGDITSLSVLASVPSVISSAISSACNLAALPVGTVFDWPGVNPPANSLKLPTSLTNISRTTYAALYAALTATSNVTMTIASPGVITWAGNNLYNGAPVALSTTGALPTGLSAGVTYYVVNLSGNTFNLATTIGGSAINTTGTQSGVHTATCAPFGFGDYSTTFGLPWLAADYAILQANANIGVATVGVLLTHQHATNSGVVAGGGGSLPAGGSIGYGNADATTMTPSGGAANIAAGVRMYRYIKYQ